MHSKGGHIICWSINDNYRQQGGVVQRLTIKLNYFSWLDWSNKYVAWKCHLTHLFLSAVMDGCHLATLKKPERFKWRLNICLNADEAALGMQTCRQCGQYLKIQFQFDRSQYQISVKTNFPGLIKKCQNILFPQFKQIFYQCKSQDLCKFHFQNDGAQSTQRFAQFLCCFSSSVNLSWQEVADTRQGAFATDVRKTLFFYMTQKQICPAIFNGPVKYYAI